ncbi:hypothetical protein PUN28_000177 [Cardiocondyla obscurior]|uniref:Secreted protein n=1 Tax=Cardiocondyla obscurior TaxID=286306 RepID=A0AAW2GY78_9HYME
MYRDRCWLTFSCVAVRWRHVTNFFETIATDHSLCLVNTRLSVINKFQRICRTVFAIFLEINSIDILLYKIM